MNTENYIVPIQSDPVNPNRMAPDIYIKVVGVGGGGGHAVNHMYKEKIEGVKFAVCNTDKQDLNRSPIPDKYLLGDGLGAGSKPEKGKEIAEQSLDTIASIFDDDCRMVFVTAGMGGGTGTGAGPVVARIAKEKGLLTVGIVTIPFVFEGKQRIAQALDGVKEFKEAVDALLVINNQRMLDVYPNLKLKEAFAHADNTLSVAARGITEMMIKEGRPNMDFNDVTSVLKDGGVALMSTGYGEGEGRLTKAIKEALQSPLLNNTDILRSKTFLMSITTSSEHGKELGMEEITEINDFMAPFNEHLSTCKWGTYEDDELGDKIKVTILAAGFGVKEVPGMRERMSQEDKEALEKAEEQQREREEMLQEYYGGSVNPQKTKHRNFFIYNAEDLDNKDVISSVDSSPTAGRKRTTLENIYATAQAQHANTADNESTSNKIHF